MGHRHGMHCMLVAVAAERAVVVERAGVVEPAEMVGTDSRRKRGSAPAGEMMGPAGGLLPVHRAAYLVLASRLLGWHYRDRRASRCSGMFAPSWDCAAR
jgi:hypothetical protein